MSDIIKKLTKTKFSAPVTARSPVIAKLTAYKAPDGSTTVSPIIAKLATARPIARPEPKQEGPVIAAMFTPYNASETSGLIDALATVQSKVGKIGRVFFDGSFKIGADLPRLVPKYNIIACVRDHPEHLKAFEHLGGNRRPDNPIEEVRERLDDEDRLLRRSEENAVEDIIGMGANAFIVMPGSARMPLIEMLAYRHNIQVFLAKPQSGLTYADDIEIPPPPANLLIVTPEFYADVPALFMVIEHLALRDRPVGKIIYTRSLAMEIVASAVPGILASEVALEKALQDPLVLFETDPDFVVVAGEEPLAGVVATEAERANKPIITFAYP